MIENTKQTVRIGFKRRKRRAQLATIGLVVLALFCMILMLVLGNTNYSLATVFDVLLGQKIQGASFAIGTIRLPRMLAGAFTGFALGLAGSVFQKMLRNTLASPDIVGVSAGSSMAAVFCILILGMSGFMVSFVACLVGLLCALLIYALANIGRFSTSRFVLIGIGMQSAIQAVISYMMVRANQYEVTGAMRWLSGSLNGIQMKSIPLLVGVVVVFTIVILLCERNLNILELGEDLATVLGVRINFYRILLIVSSVCLIAFATSVAGPIAFVSFLAGPIAVRLVGPGRSYALAAGMVGLILVLAADLLGQFAFSTRFPVGVITGVVGAPYLLLLLFGKRGKKGTL
ncbi:iron ABC transporter [Erysipelotrichaceae bacterium MTC7]|nr:iron ABC transporter [Erysipelotrichaceae bacterium MTC7]